MDHSSVRASHGSLFNLLAVAGRPDDIVQEGDDAEADKEDARRGEGVPELPARFTGVGDYAAGHSVHTQEVHGEEGDVHAYEEEPELHLAQRARSWHLAGNLGPPVIDAGKEAEDAATEEHIVEVRNHKIGVALLQV